MALMTRRFLCSAIAAMTATAVEAQTVRGTVVVAAGTTPITNASIVARGRGTATTSDRLGRFTIATAVPDTLVITAIGWRPDTILVTGPQPDRLTVALERAPVIISDLIATAPAIRPLDLSGHGRWQMPMAAARTVPPAVETDVYRALAMIPAVSFSSPLSARPLIRGYDAQEVTTRIDGFEVLNLYHLGRIFSSFPADAAEDITVSAAPYTAAHGGSTAGLIDITGRTGRLDRWHAGGGLSYGSLSAFAGGGNDRVRSFGTARVFYWKSLELIPNLDIPYHFEDLYGGLVFGPADRPTGRLTLFATQDRAGPTDGTRTFLNWDNVMLGGRWRLKDGARTTLELSTSAAHFGQQGEDVPGLHSIANANLMNRFTRLAVTGDLVSVFEQTRIASGLAIGWRKVLNQIVDAPRDFEPDPDPFGAPHAAIDAGRLEIGGYTSVSRRVGPVTAEAALRVDAAGPEASVQPRLHARWAASEGLELSIGVGRTSRLYHLLGEARAEPDFDFLDFWLPAGDSVPTARVDHATFDLNLGFAPFIGRVSVFASEGNGIGELTPETSQRQLGLFEFFRFGRSRTRGVEAQVAYRGAADSPHSLSLSYVYGRSERDWGDGWVRWSLDRTHQVRGFSQVRLGGITWFGAIDVSTGAPITPIDFILDDAGVPGIPEAPVPGRVVPVAVYGRENAAATSGTFRLDLGLGYAFGGPNHRRFTLGASVINLLATAVSQFGYATGPGEGPLALDPMGRPTPYRRLFSLPPIPTVTLRAEF